MSGNANAVTDHFRETGVISVDTSSDELHPAYFETRFRVDQLPVAWPPQFAIISAYATTGQTWTRKRNRAADRALRRHLRETNVWHWRLVGYSPATDHSEPSWACAMPRVEAMKLAIRFLQDAIYWVEQDELFVLSCQSNQSRRRVGSFRHRLRE